MSKRAAFTYGVAGDKTYWRSLDELSGSPEFQASLAHEFPEGASELADPVSRRSFMQLMGASLGLAGLQACRRPEEKILTYNKRPEDLIPGEARFYATAMPWAGGAIGLLVESHEGRPTKVEGNPQHPYSLGAANVYAQASVLDLYDPSRSKAPRMQGAQKSWDDAAGWLRSIGAKAAAREGRGFGVLVESHRSPTLKAQLDALRQKMPQARIVEWTPLSHENVQEGTRLAFGRPLQPVLELTGAKVIVALDHDLLQDDPGALRHARRFAEGRKLEGADDSMNRLYAVESVFTITGASADHRLRLPSREVGLFTAQLAKELASAHGVAIDSGVLSALPSKASSAPAKWIKALAADLAKQRGAAVLSTGPQQPAPVHALVALINAGLGSKQVRYVEPFTAAGSAKDVVELAKAMEGGQIDTVLLLGGNPVSEAPADANFEQALKKVAQSGHLAYGWNETSQAVTWHLNGTHYLEAWSDIAAVDGTASIVQPLIAPLFGGRTAAEAVELLLGGSRKAYELVQTTWKNTIGGASFESSWRRALHDGVLAGTAAAAVEATPAPAALSSALSTLGAGDGIEVTFSPDSHAWDGRFSNNGWLQEMPDQMTKVTWGNGALVSPATAKAQGLSDGDEIEVTVGGRSIKAAALVQPGQADDSIALTLGMGRPFYGQVSDAKPVDERFGYDAYPIRTADALWIASGAQVKKTGGTVDLARTQEHHSMAAPTLMGVDQPARPLVREASLVQFKSRPTFAKEMVKFPKVETAEGKKEIFNLFGDFKEHAYEGHKWGMAIDLNACIGCNACMIACQAENNIPLVGKDGVIRGREMHWIRIDRYFEGTAEEPHAVMQPIACQHCENAPCELVCPVAATSHSDEGINEMTYNRCVGTRYCANNCPYKVRRFNFFNYSKDIPELRRMQFNPDVTVRSRGVMEKCSYCIQRVQEAKIARRREAAAEGSTDIRVRDGSVTSACAQTCPSNAIVFGDLNDTTSLVSKAAANPRAYLLLEEINTRPRTSFLARVRNPNPELEAA